MSFKIASGVSVAIIAFAIISAVGSKIPYEVALTGMLAVLTYWSQSPTQHRPQAEGEDAEH